MLCSIYESVDNIAMDGEIVFLIFIKFKFFCSNYSNLFTALI